MFRSFNNHLHLDRSSASWCDIVVAVQRQTARNKSVFCLLLFINKFHLSVSPASRGFGPRCSEVRWRKRCMLSQECVGCKRMACKLWNAFFKKNKRQQLSSASISCSGVQLISLTECFLMNLASPSLPKAKTHTQSHNSFACSNALIGLYSIFPADYRAARWSCRALSHPQSVKLKPSWHWVRSITLYTTNKLL